VLRDNGVPEILSVLCAFLRLEARSRPLRRPFSAQADTPGRRSRDHVAGLS